MLVSIQVSYNKVLGMTYSSLRVVCLYLLLLYPDWPANCGEWHSVVWEAGESVRVCLWWCVCMNDFREERL